MLRAILQLNAAGVPILSCGNVLDVTISGLMMSGDLGGSSVIRGGIVYPEWVYEISNSLDRLIGSIEETPEFCAKLHCIIRELLLRETGTRSVSDALPILRQRLMVGEGFLTVFDKTLSILSKLGIEEGRLQRDTVLEAVRSVEMILDRYIEQKRALAVVGELISIDPSKGAQILNINQLNRSDSEIYIILRLTDLKGENVGLKFFLGSESIDDNNLIKTSSINPDGDDILISGTIQIPITSEQKMRDLRNFLRLSIVSSSGTELAFASYSLDPNLYTKDGSSSFSPELEELLDRDLVTKDRIRIKNSSASVVGKSLHLQTSIDISIWNRIGEELTVSMKALRPDGREIHSTFSDLRSLNSQKGKIKVTPSWPVENYKNIILSMSFESDLLKIDDKVFIEVIVALRSSEIILGSVQSLIVQPSVEPDQNITPLTVKNKEVGDANRKVSIWRRPIDWLFGVPEYS